MTVANSESIRTHVAPFTGGPAPQTENPMRSHKHGAPRCHRRAFTLVELLVVIGIIALLISILLPTLNRARESANAVKCGANLQQFGQAINIYAAENKGRFLPAYFTPVRGVYTALNAADFPTFLVYLPGIYLRENYGITQCPSDTFANYVAGGNKPTLKRLFSGTPDVRYSYAMNDVLPRGKTPIYTSAECGGATATPAVIVSRFNPRNLRGLKDSAQTIYLLETGAAALLHPIINIQNVAPLGQAHKGFRYDHGGRDTTGTRPTGTRMNILFADGHVAQLMDKEMLPQKRPLSGNANDQTGWPETMRQYWFGAPNRIKEYVNDT